MDFHSIPNYTQLKLQLALNPTPSSMAENTTKKPNYSTSDHRQPSLTLALSGDSCSSFSNAITHVIKRETEVASCESEKGVENLQNISGEYDEDGGVNGKKKLRLTKAQSGLLEQAFRLHTTLHPKEKQKLARDLKLRPRQVEVWFQNRRARTKMKQTEMDYQYLKKWQKTLTDENQRLRQQIQQLKVQAQPMYMAATLLTVCPSCQQTGDTNSAPTKPYLFDPFTSSSAAC